MAILPISCIERELFHFSACMDGNVEFNPGACDHFYFFVRKRRDYILWKIFF